MKIVNPHKLLPQHAKLYIYIYIEYFWIVTRKTYKTCYIGHKDVIWSELISQWMAEPKLQFKMLQGQTCRKESSDLRCILKSYMGTCTDCPSLSFSTHSKSCSVSNASIQKIKTSVINALISFPYQGRTHPSLQVPRT